MSLGMVGVGRLRGLGQRLGIPGQVSGGTEQLSRDVDCESSITRNADSCKRRAAPQQG